MKFCGKILVIVAACLFLAVAHAEPVSQLHPSNYVNDFAGCSWETGSA